MNLSVPDNDYIGENRFSAANNNAEEGVDGFEKLLAACRTAVERYVRAHISSRTDAEDVLQETYLAAFGSFGGLRDRASFLPWILGIARRKCADYYRAQAGNRLIFTENLPEQAQVLPEYSAVEETLGRLPERDRLMLRLFYGEALSQKQISDQLRIPEGTVKSRMSAARTKFRAAYPYPPKEPAKEPVKDLSEESPAKPAKGGKNMEHKGIPELPEKLPEYTIVWKDEPAFSVVCEEMTGWFVVPHIGEKLVWGMYDLPSGRLDVAYEMTVTGPARVHGLDGVAIRARVLSPRSDFEDKDPMRDAVVASTGGQEEWTFIAQEKDGYTRFLSAEHVEEGVRTLTTFLDGDAFMNSWGFGEDNCGMPIHIESKSRLVRKGNEIKADRGFIDVAGRCELTLDGVVHDTICVMDLGMYEEGMVSEQFLDRSGRTVLWRRFNRDDWAVDRYGRLWSELLPENEQLIINGRRYVHWYDCLCVR